MSYGPGSLAQIDNSGYNSVNIQHYIYPFVKGKTIYVRPSWHYWYNVKDPLSPQKRYIINAKGLRKLAELHNKFKNIKIDPEPYV